MTEDEDELTPSEEAFYLFLEENQERWHHAQIDDNGIAYSGFNAGIRYIKGFLDKKMLESLRHEVRRHIVQCQEVMLKEIDANFSTKNAMLGEIKKLQGMELYLDKLIYL